MDLQVQCSSGLPLKHSRLAKLMLAFYLRHDGDISKYGTPAKIQVVRIRSGGCW